MSTKNFVSYGDAETLFTGIGNKLSTLKSGLTNLDNEVNGDATTYDFADVITIEDAVPANLADCSVKIEPVQDLHWFDKPWVGGAGKNKLPLVLADIKAANTTGTWNGNVYTINQGTITVSVDDADNIIGFVVNGTFSSTAKFNIFNGTFSAGSYKITGGINNGLAFGARNNAGSMVYSTGSEVAYNLTEDKVSCDAHILIGADTFADRVLYPMIRLSTETDATFAPYTNICPISGHTEASVQRDGKNWFSGYYDYNSTTKYSPLLPNTQYTISAKSDGSKQVNYQYIYKDNSFGGNAKLIASGSTSGSVTVITPDNVKGINIYTVGIASVSENIAYDGQVELGSSATPYVPYSGKTYTIALGDTIYGGTVDFDSGVMTVDRAYFKITSTDDFVNNAPYPTAQYKVGAITDFVVDVDNRPISDRYVRGSGSGTINYGGSTTKFIRITTAQEYESKEAAFEEINGTEICYRIEPTTIQLTPQQIQLLKGQNTLTASTGQISVTVNGVSGAIGQVQEQVNELAGEHRLIAESGTTGTLSAKIDSLYSAYTALTDEEKQRCYLVYGNTFNIQNISVSNRKFGSVGKLNVGSLFVESVFIQISASNSTMIKLIVNATGNSFEDMSSTENNNKVQLYI